MWSVLSVLLAQTPPAVKIEPSDTTAWSGIINLQLAGIISGVITFLLIAAAIIFFFILVMGGIKWIMSQGEESKVKAARDQVTHALIGLVIVFAAWAIIRLISYAFGGLNLLKLEFPRFVQ